jgi:hypothetical protein
LAKTRPYLMVISSIIMFKGKPTWRDYIEGVEKYEF